MEYIFGTDRLNGVEVENLKTAGDAHSDLEGTSRCAGCTTTA